MIKALWSLLVRGILFNPVIFGGGLLGILAYAKLSLNQLQVLLLDYHFYLLFFVLCSLYVYIFKKSYKSNYVHTDWKATILNIIKHFFLMLFSFAFGILLGSYFDFSALVPKRKPASYEYNEYSEVMSVQKQVQDWQKNYNNMLDNIK